MANKLALDELPKRLLKEGATVEDTLMIYGFVGKGTSEDTITFYLDPALKTSMVIKDSDIIHHVKVTKAHSPIGGTVIWIKNASSYTQGATAQVQQVQVQTQTQQNAAQFFQGDIYQQFANTIQGNTTPKPKDMHTPVCGCGKCGQ
jgi:uncharacterized protein (DUF1330 family)